MVRSREKGESSKSKTKNKGKAKVEKVDAIGVKRSRHEESSQGMEKGESSREPTRTQCAIGIFDFGMGESFNAYDLVHDV